MEKSYRWGIIGTGNIAHKFAKSLEVIPQARIQAVLSRSLTNANSFASKFSIPNIYTDIEQFLCNNQIDIVYIATPNNKHFEQSVQALLHDKAVLCEKPATLSVSEMEQIIKISAERNIFYMEAMWTRFLPTILMLEKLINDNTIGTIKHIIADFGIKPAYNENSRLFNKSLGGGSIWDIGIYPIFLVHHFLGFPDNITAQQTITPTGVDMSTICSFLYTNGTSAQLFSSFNSNSLTEAKIIGTEGCLKLHSSFHTPTKLTLHKNNTEEEIPLQYESNGYSYQARHVMDCLDKNISNSPLFSQQTSLKIQQIIETINKMSTKIKLEL